MGTTETLYPQNTHKIVKPSPRSVYLTFVILEVSARQAGHPSCAEAKEMLSDL